MRAPRCVPALWAVLLLSALVPLPSRASAKKANTKAKGADDFQVIGNKAMRDFSSGASHWFFIRWCSDAPVPHACVRVCVCVSVCA